MSEDVTLTIERESLGNGVVVLDLGGELVITNREELDRRGEAELADGARSLVIVAGGLTHVDTSGLAILVRLANRCAEAEGRLAVAGLPADFQDIRQHLFLDEALIFAESVEEAVAAVSR